MSKHREIVEHFRTIISRTKIGDFDFTYEHTAQVAKALQALLDSERELLELLKTCLPIVEHHNEYEGLFCSMAEAITATEER